MRSLSPEFLEVLFGEDDLGVVIRTHIYIESNINALLEKLIPFPKELPRLRYEQKLKLCCAMGMDTSLFPRLKELGDLRNSFGHNINTKLSQTSVDKLLNSASRSDLDTIVRSYKTTLIGSKESLPTSFNELDIRSQLIGFSIWLNATLDALNDDAVAVKEQREKTGLAFPSPDFNIP